LVVQRRAGQSIVIGDDVTVEIVEVREENVKVLITAPKTVKIWRKELVDKGQSTGR